MIIVAPINNILETYWDNTFGLPLYVIPRKEEISKICVCNTNIEPFYFCPNNNNLFCLACYNSITTTFKQDFQKIINFHSIYIKKRHLINCRLCKKLLFKTQLALDCFDCLLEYIINGNKLEERKEILVNNRL